MKKTGLMSVVLALLIISTMVLPVAAVENCKNNTTYQYSEYDWIVSVRQGKERGGISISELAEIQSNQIEQELLTRKNCTDQELRDVYGYSKEDIAILRTYNGEPLESNSALRALTATLTLEVPSVVDVSGSMLEVAVEWEWDQKPVTTNTDGLAVGWTSTHGNVPGKMRFIVANSSHNVTYTGVGTNRFDRGWVIEEEGAKSEFSMMYGTYNWASSGEATMYWQKTSGSPSLTSMDVVIKYAHAQFTVTPSIDLTLAGAVNITGTTATAGEQSGFVNVSTGIWNRN